RSAFLHCLNVDGCRERRTDIGPRGVRRTDGQVENTRGSGSLPSAHWHCSDRRTRSLNEWSWLQLHTRAHDCAPTRLFVIARRPPERERAEFRQTVANPFRVKTCVFRSSLSR